MKHVCTLAVWKNSFQQASVALKMPILCYNYWFHAASEADAWNPLIIHAIDQRFSSCSKAIIVNQDFNEHSFKQASLALKMPMYFTIIDFMR